MRETPMLREQIRQLSELNGGRQTMNLKRAAEVIGCDPRTLRDRMNLKKSGRRYIVPLIAVAEWIVSNT